MEIIIGIVLVAAIIALIINKKEKKKGQHPFPDNPGGSIIEVSPPNNQQEEIKN